jgi:hypothetical protein
VGRHKQKVRLSIETLEGRAVPAQLGQVVTLPELTGLGEEVARTAPADPGGHTSLKVDPGSIVTVKIDPGWTAGLKIDTHLKIDTSLKIDTHLKYDTGLKIDPSGPAGLKIDTSFFHNGEEQA